MYISCCCKYLNWLLNNHAKPQRLQWLQACKNSQLLKYCSKLNSMCSLFLLSLTVWFLVFSYTAKTTVWISYQNRYAFTFYTGHTKNGMNIIPWRIIPKMVWSSYHKIVWFSSMNWCHHYSASSSIIHARYMHGIYSAFFCCWMTSLWQSRITRHTKEMHWHKKQ